MEDDLFTKAIIVIFALMVHWINWKNALTLSVFVAGTLDLILKFYDN